MANKKRIRKALSIKLLIIFLLIVLPVIGFYLGMNFHKNAQNKTYSSTKTTNVMVKQSHPSLPINEDTLQVELGMISGNLSYPSSFVPSDLVICAQSINFNFKKCTTGENKQYTMQLPIGDYNVYSYLPDPKKYGATFPKDYKAYYSEQVHCTTSPNCDHTPITVHVSLQQPLNNIDPNDWYK